MIVVNCPFLRNLSPKLFHPHFIIRILSSAFCHPHFVIRILSSAFCHPHFSIRHPPSAIRRHPVRTLQRPLPFTSLAATVPKSGNSKACLIDRSKRKRKTLHDLTCHATVHRHMKTADVCHYANAKIPEISVGSSDQNIWDHPWKWS